MNLESIFNLEYFKQISNLDNRYNDSFSDKLLYIEICPLISTIDPIGVPLLKFRYFNKEAITNKKFTDELFPYFYISYPEHSFNDVINQLLVLSPECIIKEREDCYTFFIKTPDFLIPHSYIDITHHDESVVAELNIAYISSGCKLVDLSCSITETFKILKCENPKYLEGYIKQLNRLKNVKDILEKGINDLSENEKLLLELI